METPTIDARSEPTKLPAAVLDSIRLRREGRNEEALRIVASALDDARLAPVDFPFRDRIRLGLTLAELHLTIGQRKQARAVLEAESDYAEWIHQAVRRNGSKDQARAAAAGYYQLRDRQRQVALHGHPAPEIDVQDWIMGTQTTLAELRGNVVLLEFWAGWCIPCLKTFPILEELHQRFKGDGLAVLALTHYDAHPDDGRASSRVAQLDAATRIVTGRNLSFRVGISRHGSIRDKYGARGLPSYTLIDRSGVVRPTPAAADHAALKLSIVDLLAESALDE